MKWWNSVPRPATWWRFSGHHQDAAETNTTVSNSTSERPAEDPLPQLPDGVTPDDVLQTATSSPKQDCVTTSPTPTHRSLTGGEDAPVMEGIPDIRFSFFSEQQRAVTRIQVEPEPVEEKSSLVAVLRRPDKKSPNISRITILSVNNSMTGESPYAAPRAAQESSSVPTDSSQPVTVSTPMLNSSPNSEEENANTCKQSTHASPIVEDHKEPKSSNSDSEALPVQTSAIGSCQEPNNSSEPNNTIISENDPQKSIQPAVVLTSVQNSSVSEDKQSENSELLTSTNCSAALEVNSSSPLRDSTVSGIQNSLNFGTQDSLVSGFQDSDIGMQGSTPHESLLSTQQNSPDPVSVPEDAAGKQQDWETITDYSDYTYYEMTAGQQAENKATAEGGGDVYEDVQTSGGRVRGKERERRINPVRTRIRRAWVAVRGWWSAERGRLNHVILRHAHAQAVRQEPPQEDAKPSVVLVRRRRHHRECSRPPSRIQGLRRSKYFPEGQNGFEELRRYIKQGGDFCKELSQILQERSEAETQYAKSLSKLSGKLLKASKDGVGTVTQAWQRAGAQMEAQSEVHRVFAAALSEEVVKPLRQLVEAQHRIRKSVEVAVDKTGKNLGEWRTAESKSKKASFLAARENEKLQDGAILSRASSITGSTAHLHANTAGTPAKDNTKLESKRRKAEEAMKKADVEYYTFSLRAERARLEWETAVIRGSHCFQALEEERLQQLKDLAGRYLHHLQDMAPKIVQGVERLREPIEECDVARDIQTVVSIKGTGQPIPEQLLPDFYAEHITLAMNRDRRRQALVKLLQLIRQDLDRERRGKQGVENLARALQQTPTFGAEDSQQNVTEKLHHMRSMLTYLEAMRYKVQSALAELDGRTRGGHPLAAHIQVTRDRQGLQQSILKVPPWVREESLDRLAGDSPDWTDRGTADGNSVQPDSDFDEFSSQGSEKDYQSSVLTQCPAPPLEAVPSIGRCRALYEYTANLYDELNLQPGDIIKIHDKQADGWWLGELNGTVGIFPATYVQEMD